VGKSENARNNVVDSALVQFILQSRVFLRTQVGNGKPSGSAEVLTRIPFAFVSRSSVFGFVKMRNADCIREIYATHYEKRVTRHWTVRYKKLKKTRRFIYSFGDYAEKEREREREWEARIRRNGKWKISRTCSAI